MLKLNKAVRICGLALGLVLGLTACTGQDLLNGSGDSSLGQFIAHIREVHHPTPNDDGSFPDYDDPDGRAFANNLGFDIVLTHSTLSWQHLTLISDGNDPDCVGGSDQDVELNGTVDLLGDDLVTSLLISHPIEDAVYCSFRLILAPQEEGDHQHALLADHADEGTDATIHLEGEWALAGASGDFNVDSVEEVTVEGNFRARVDGVLGEHPVHFHEGETELTIIFGLEYDALFADVDFENDSQAYTDVSYEKSDLLIFGAEGAGLPNEIHQRYADRRLTIPMPGPVRSLNLATSVGIALYEAYRQMPQNSKT